MNEEVDPEQLILDGTIDAVEQETDLRIKIVPWEARAKKGGALDAANTDRFTLETVAKPVLHQPRPPMAIWPRHAVAEEANFDIFRR